MVFEDINALKQGEGKRIELNAVPEPDEDEKEKAKFRETGCGAIARNKYFEYTTLAVICLNALYLGYDSDYNARWEKPEKLYDSNLYGFIIFDNFFCVYFTIEVLIRFLAYKNVEHSCCDLSFVFDLFLVVLMIVETWVFAFIGTIDALKQVSILRLLRLARLLRMGKIMRYFPELQLIVKGMVAAVRAVACCAALQLLCLYVFAIIFTSEYHQGLKPDDDPDIPEIEVLFGSLGKSMRHLLIMATILDDITACTNAIRSTNKPMMMVAFMAAVLISSFTLFNMLLGILCEVVEATGHGEAKKNEEKALHDTIIKFFKSMDLNHDGTISREEFFSMRDEEHVMAALEKLDIEEESFNKYGEILFCNTSKLQFHEAVAMIMKLRPGASINACDLGLFKTMYESNKRAMNRYLDSLERLLEPPEDDEEEDEQFAVEAAAETAASDLALNKVDSSRPGSTESASRTAKTRNGQARPAGKPGSAERPRPQKRPPKPNTVEYLAQSRAAVVGLPPPLQSRWKETLGMATHQEEIDDRPTSPKSPKVQPKDFERSVPNSGDVQSKLEALQQKRRARSTEVRFTMQQRNSGIMPQLSDLRGTAEGELPPFSPNQMVSMS